MPKYQHARPRGFAPWSPNPKSQDVIADVQEIIEVEAAFLPLTARQVFYRLHQNFGYPKTERFYNNLCEKLNRGRRAGMLPWDAIRDDGVQSSMAHGFYSVMGFKYYLTSLTNSFSIIASQVQDCHVELIVEAAGMMPQIARVANPMGASVYSSGGFGSVTAQYDTAKRIAKRHKPTVVLSIGDFDPSGISLYHSFKENVLRFHEQGTEFLGPEWGGEGTTRLGLDIGMYEEPREAPLFRRIAVTPDQIRQYAFTTAPAKKTDRRGDWKGGTVQCEAIPSALLADIVRDEILKHYSADATAELRELMKSVRPELRASLDTDMFAAVDGNLWESIDEIRRDHGGGDWTGGFANSDDDNMEEGIIA